MQFFGFLSILFGIIVIADPAILAYLIGILFLGIGMNILVVSYYFRRGSTSENKSWKMGSYEIIKNHKK